MLQTAALWLEESALPCRSHTVIFYQLMASQVVTSVQKNHIANPAGAGEQDNKQQSPGNVRGGRRTGLRSCLDVGKAGEAETCVHSAARGQAHFNFKTLKTHLCAAVTSRAFNRGY